MKLYHVVTPEYDYTEYVCAEGGPTYPVCDVIEIEAKTRRDAVALGVREMLRGGKQGRYERFRWCLDQRLDGLSPYAGVKAYEVCTACVPFKPCGTCDVGLVRDLKGVRA